LYGGEAWSLTLREEHQLRLFENWILRRIFGPEREKVAGDCGRLHKEELYNLYTSPTNIRVIKSRRMRWESHVACIGDVRNAYEILFSKPEEKSPFGRYSIHGRIIL
jgi:hypothetical protein